MINYNKKYVTSKVVGFFKTLSESDKSLTLGGIKII